MASSDRKPAGFVSAYLAFVQAQEEQDLMDRLEAQVAQDQMKKGGKGK